MSVADKIEELVNQVKERKPKSVLLQLPEGLKVHAVEIAEAIQNEGIRTVVSAEPCYGACDLPDGELNIRYRIKVRVGRSVVADKYIDNPATIQVKTSRAVEARIREYGGTCPSRDSLPPEPPLE